MAVISVDFDGTCVKHKYPEVGEDIGAQKVLKALVEKGHKLILLTMRDEKAIQPALDWFKNNNIPLWGINENPTQKRWSNSRKVYADIYIDDQYLGCPKIYDQDSGRFYVDWNKVAEYLEEFGYL